MFLLSHKHFSKKIKMWAVAFCHVECCSLLVQHKETLVLLLEIEIRILDLIREEEKRGSTEEDWCSWSTTTYSSLVTSIII
jgi:hypothetical protein